MGGADILSNTNICLDYSKRDSDSQSLPSPQPVVRQQSLPSPPPVVRQHSFSTENFRGMSFPVVPRGRGRPRKIRTRFKEPKKRPYLDESDSGTSIFHSDCPIPKVIFFFLLLLMKP